MQQGNVDRRRGRRADVQASLRIQGTSEGKSEWVKAETTQNVSLAGVYFETEDGGTYHLNHVVTMSISIPSAQTRLFPFTRLAGRGRVIRVRKLPQEESTTTKRYGVSLEFGEDLTALTALPAS